MVLVYANLVDLDHIVKFKNALINAVTKVFAITMSVSALKGTKE
jgi:hypothetical protein